MSCIKYIESEKVVGTSILRIDRSSGFLGMIIIDPKEQEWVHQMITLEGQTDQTILVQPPRT